MLGDLVRVVLAGLFVFVGIAVVVGVVALLGAFETLWGILVAPVLALVILGLMVLAFGLFNQRLKFDGKTAEERVREMREQGLLVDEPYTAKRAFAVEEFEDEGSTYFVELTDGRVLFLNGQYLYEYEPIVDEAELNQPRLFPCTEFTVVRHKDNGFVVEIDCRGEVLEPEVTAPHLGEEWFGEEAPEDGEIISDVAYDDLKEELMQGGAQQD